MFDETREIAIIWGVEDVQGVFDGCTCFGRGTNTPEKIPDRDAMDILHICERKHDAQYGIGWDTIAIIANEYYDEKHAHDVGL